MRRNGRRTTRGRYARLVQRDQDLWKASVAAELQDGQSEKFGFYISNLILRQGNSIPLERAGVTAIVGGNNVGKSSLLRELYDGLLQSQNQNQGTSHVLQSASTVLEGDDKDFLAWLALTAPYSARDPHNVGFRTSDQIFQPAQALAYHRLGRDQNNVGPLRSLLAHFAIARDRFQYCLPAGRRGDLNDPPTHPLHWIEQNAQLKSEFQAAAKDIFDCDLTLDPVSGSLFFRVGKPESPAPPIDRIAEGNYLNELLQLPTLETQGDGMQSALSLLMPVITSTFPLVLVDEPEAFLHPPQARKLGAILARLAHFRKVQLIVATHDRHFLTGLLDASEVSVSVVRLSRDGDTSQSKHLDAAKLRQAWGTASIRHSNLLDGLFHKLVVIAENERDCQFFAAALEALDSEEALPLRPHDVLFVPSAGKGNIPALAEVLVASGVPVVASPDLDILNSEGSVEKLYTVLGGSWPTIKSTYLAATAEFQVPRAARTHRQVIDMVTGVLGTEPDATYTNQSKKDVAVAMGVESEWRRLKEYGTIAFKAHPVKAQELLDDLAAHGIVPAHVGELEGFARSVEVRKGDGWLEAAIASDAHRGADVQEHLRRILASGGFPTSSST